MWPVMLLQLTGLTHLPKGGGRVAAQQLCRGGHLLAADQEALVVPLIALPGQATPQQEQQSVCQ